MPRQPKEAYDLTDAEKRHASFPRKRESSLDRRRRWIPAFAGMTDPWVLADS